MKAWIIYWSYIPQDIVSPQGIRDGELVLIVRPFALSTTGIANLIQHLYLARIGTLSEQLSLAKRSAASRKAWDMYIGRDTVGSNPYLHANYGEDVRLETLSDGKQGVSWVRYSDPRPSSERSRYYAFNL
jgi:hypothetical protein